MEDWDDFEAPFGIEAIRIDAPIRAISVVSTCQICGKEFAYHNNKLICGECASRLYVDQLEYRVDSNAEKIENIYNEIAYNIDRSHECRICLKTLRSVWNLRRLCKTFKGNLLSYSRWNG